MQSLTTATIGQILWHPVAISPSIFILSLHPFPAVEPPTPNQSVQAIMVIITEPWQSVESHTPMQCYQELWKLVHNSFLNHISITSSYHCTLALDNRVGPRWVSSAGWGKAVGPLTRCAPLPCLLMSWIWRFALLRGCAQHSMWRAPRFSHTDAVLLDWTAMLCAEHSGWLDNCAGRANLVSSNTIPAQERIFLLQSGVACCVDKSSKDSFICVQ